ncbi:MAG: creatininase family protein [Actinomycetota bacterium]
MTLREFGNLRGPQVSQQLTSTSVLVLPVGAIEQHGPHLPLNTDLVVAEAVSRSAVERVGERLECWLLPSLAVSKSNEHAWSAGTLWLSARTLLSVLEDIGRSVATTPARKLVFVNGHGGNSSLLSVANRELRLKYGLQTFLTHPHMPADQGGTSSASEMGMGVHGGDDETSVMLHLRPELVDMSLAVRRVPEKLATNKHVRFGGTVSFGWLSNDFHADGHIGDPTKATAERGKVLFDGAIADLCSALEEIHDFEFGR